MRRAWLLLAVAAGVILAGAALLAATWHLSYGHGLYCSLGIASTVGCDASPPGAAGRVAASVVILATIPALAAVFAMLTGLHLRGHLRASEERMKRHLEDRLAEHHKNLTVRPAQRKPAKPNGSGERLARPEERM